MAMDLPLRQVQAIFYVLFLVARHLPATLEEVSRLLGAYTAAILTSDS
jgi:hypothetical protein